MSDELTYDEVVERLSAYVLGALEPEEMLAVDAYLSKHQALLARLQKREEAAAQLAHLAPIAPLPADVKERLMKRVHADLANGPIETAQIKESSATAHSGQKTSSGSQPDKPAIDRGGWLTNVWAALKSVNGWAVAAACLFLILLGVALYAGQMQSQLAQMAVNRDEWQADTAQLQERLRRLEADRDQFQAEVARLQVENDQLQDDLKQVRASQDESQTRLLELQQANQRLQQRLQIEQANLDLVANTTPLLVPGTEEAPDARGVFYLGQNDQALVALHGLEPLPPQQTYQLWLIPSSEAAPVPAGLLEFQEDSGALQSVQVPPEAGDFSAIGVSVEPAGGSPAPTGPIVLLGPIS